MSTLRFCHPMRFRITMPLIIVGLLVGCSSSSGESPQTTVSPLEAEVENLKKQVDQLQTQLNATTIPTTTTTLLPTTTTAKPAAKLVDVRRFFSGYTKGNGSSTQHECREIFVYSDGTEFESPRRWVSTGQNAGGGYTIRDC